MSNTKFEVVELQTSETYALRTAVLRDDTPTSDPKYAEDLNPGTVHLGIFDENRNLIARYKYTISRYHNIQRNSINKLGRFCYIAI